MAFREGILKIFFFSRAKKKNFPGGGKPFFYGGRGGGGGLKKSRAPFLNSGMGAFKCGERVSSIFWAKTGKFFFFFFQGVERGGGAFIFVTPRDL